MPAPLIHCPAIHVASVAPATDGELAPVLAYLRGAPAKPATRRFGKGATQNDGRLDFCKQGLGPGGLAAVLDALASAAPRSSWLTHLLLGTNGLGDEGAEVLGAALARGLAVETLYLGCNVIGSAGASALARGLSGHRDVRALWLKRNPLGDEGLTALLEVLPRTRLRTLDLTNCALGDAGIARVVRTLERRDVSIEHLFLGGNGLSDPTALARWLADPACSARSVFLGASRLGDAGARVLFDALASNRSVTALDLASNAIGEQGLERCAAQARHLSLSWLNLGTSPATAKLEERANTFGDEAVPLLARTCAAPLMHLGLAGTALTSRGARALLGSVSSLPRAPAIVFGAGIARRLRQSGRALSAQRAPVPEDVLRIASVYR